MGLTRLGDALEGFEAYDAGQGMVPQDLAPQVIKVGAQETPFLMKIGMNGDKPKSKKHEWVDDVVHATEWTINEALDDSETDIDVTANADQAYEGTLVLVDSEIMWITASPDSTSWTVVRGAAGTTAATHDDQATARLAGSATYDNVAYPTSKIITRASTYNWLQQILLPVEVDDITRELETTGTSDELDYQVEGVLADALVHLSRALLIGKADDTAPQGSATVPGTMNGIKEMITTNANAAGGVRLTEARLRASLKTCWDNGGQPDVILGDSYQTGIISSWIEGRVRYSPGDATAGRQTVGFYRSQYGIQEIVMDRWMLPGDLFCLQTEHIEVAPLIPFRLGDFARISTSTRRAVQGVFTAVLRGEKKQSKITGLANS